MYRFYCRFIQKVLFAVSPFLPWREPEILQGPGSLRTLPALIKGKKWRRVLVITDEGIRRAGLLNQLLALLEEADISYALYEDTSADPTIENIEEAARMYAQEECDVLLAFGGGSPIDCAKGTAARTARPEKDLYDLRGLLRIRRTIPPVITVPTTSGTGSEATLAAVVTESVTHKKFTLIDPSLIPHYAVLDPLLTVSLPSHITAATGMDALTHAVEAYIGKSNTASTRMQARRAVKLIFDNLPGVWENGGDADKREKMQIAAHEAGKAFTRAFVGNVHAAAHALGGFYGVPHGLANAVILPHVLEQYGSSVHRPLAQLADLTGCSSPGQTTAEKARSFIQAVRDMNEHLHIPAYIEGIQEADIPVMIERALSEANPLYPVPRIFTKADMRQIYEKISPPAASFPGKKGT
ncbi:MAG: iron-containing alcohol dehydrogenase [Alkalicoccus sp.]|nr:MAG: iron-containing alcohol dehydrogenase [Alkalicoccus sp.]